MRNAILAAGLAALVAGCGTFDGRMPGDPSRDGFGVSMHQPSEGAGVPVDPAVARTLDWKARQLCTLGYRPTASDIVPAEGDKEVVDQKFLCKDYSLSVLGIQLGGVVPAMFPPKAAP